MKNELGSRELSKKYELPSTWRCVHCNQMNLHVHVPGQMHSCQRCDKLNKLTYVIHVIAVAKVEEKK